MMFELIYHSYIQWHVNERGRKTIAQGGRGRTMKWRRRKGFKGAEDRVAFASEDRRNTDANVTSWPQGAGGVDFAALPPFRPPRDRNRRHCQSQSGGGECNEEREKGEKHMADGLPYVQAYRMRQSSGTQLFVQYHRDPIDIYHIKFTRAQYSIYLQIIVALQN